MQKNINKVVKLIDKNNLELQAIEFINSLFDKKIQKNPNYRTFRDWIKENNLEKEIEDESEYAWRFDEWASIFEEPEIPENLPWICENEFFWCGGCAIKYFFRKNPKLVNEFLAKQTLV